MKVSTAEPFQIVYSLFEHEFLGHLFAAFVVQLGPRGQLTLQHQTVSGKNVHEFAAALDATDFELVELCDQIQQEAVVKEFWPRKIATAEFFLKTYNAEKGDKPLQEAIARQVQTRMAGILARLAGKRVFIMGRDGEPTWREIALAPAKASILFHFRRNEEGTHYFPTIQYQGQRLDFQYKDALLVCLQPAWLLLGDLLYSFRTEVDGRKLLPFLKKKFIVVPRQVEESYFQKFVAPLMESFEVHARGFDIRSERYVARPLLTFSDAQPPVAAPEAPVRPPGPPRRGRVPQPKPLVPVLSGAETERIHFELSFRYGPHLMPLGTDKPVSVRLEKTADSYVFHRLLRSPEQEQATVAQLQERLLTVAHGQASLPKSEAFKWLHDHTPALTELGYTVEAASTATKNYFIGPTSVQVGIQEAGDWFDVRGTVRFGDIEVPFIRLRGHILQRRREFKLPNGQIAIIPEEWFTDYMELFAFGEETPDGLNLRRHHLALVADLQSNDLATVRMGRKLAKLRDFAEVEDHPLPVGFLGELRPYQKAGYNWLRFVQDYHFGGCLADDMGLGKAQPLHANILTPKGWRTMGDLRVGDPVINSQGRTSHVTGVFPQGEKEIFRVTFTDNSTVECCAEHLWAVQSPVQKYRGQAYHVKALHELRGDLHDKHGNTKWFIPMVKPVEFGTQSVPMDPYFMGLLLGDGCFRQHSIRLSTTDAEIVNYVAQGLSPALTMRQQGQTCDYTFVKSAAGWTNELMQQIQALGLKGTNSFSKFVPQVYLHNDVATRLATLQGLLDSDGYTSAQGDVCQFSSVSPQLVEGVTFLSSRWAAP